MEEKILILKMLSEGKISAEEAERLLAAIGADPDARKSNNSYQSNQANSTPGSRFDSKMKDFDVKMKDFSGRINEKFNAKNRAEMNQKIENITGDITGAATKFADKMAQFVGGIVEKATSNYKYTNSFEFSPADLKKIFISANNCKFKVTRTDSPEIKLTLEINSFLEVNSFEGIVESKLEANDFFIKIKLPSSSWGVAELFLPEKLEEAEIRSSNGQISISNYNVGVLKSITSNAKIVMSEVTAAEIEAFTDNAKVELENVKSDYCVIRSSNGKVDIDRCQIINLNVKTSNGKIDIPCLLVSNDANYEYAFESSNGAVSVNFNEVLPHGFMIDATTSNGKIDVNLDSLKFSSSKSTTFGSTPVKLFSENYDQSSAKINIKVKTSNGAISVEES